MNRIDATFQKLRSDRKPAFIAYICAGDPDLESTRKLALAFDRLGVDILELGVPFSDPMADGTVNQSAAERALAAGTTVAGVFAMIRQIRLESEMPIVLYNYMNPIFNYGFDRFLRDASEAGCDGLLLLDLPPEEEIASPEFASTGDLHHIRLIAPTTPDDRLRSIASRGEGFIYYVSREGVTGERSDVASGLEERVALIREASPVPVAVGFGVSTPAQARAIGRLADGVVVGSAIVRRIAEHGKDPDLVAKVAEVVKPLVEATKSA